MKPIYNINPTQKPLNESNQSKGMGIGQKVNGFFDNPANSMGLIAFGATLLENNGISTASNPKSLGEGLSKGIMAFVGAKQGYEDRERAKKLEELRNDSYAFDLLRKQALAPFEIESARRDSLNPYGSNIPAPLQLANEYEKALKEGNSRRANNIATFSKAFDKGVFQNSDGSFVSSDGYGEALGDIRFEQKKGEDLGKDRAEKISSLNSQLSKMPQLEATVKKLSELGKKGTYTYAGRARDEALRQTGMPLPQAAVARTEYISLVDNQILPLLRDTFGSQFTQKEGETLKNTLGDPNKSPEEKDAVLRSFIDQKTQNIESLKRELGDTPNLDYQGKASSKQQAPTNQGFKLLGFE